MMRRPYIYNSTIDLFAPHSLGALRPSSQISATCAISLIPEMSSNIPHELYQDIISHLSHDHDSGTRALINAAQCSWALRREAQRNLFRNPFLFIWQSSLKLNSGGFSILQSHEAFLEVILHSPTRLGPLVRSYNQFQISYNQAETGGCARLSFQTD